MTIPTLVTGDDFTLPVNLTINDVAVNVAAAAITAGVVSGDHSALLLGAVAQAADAPGANWSAGAVTVVFGAAATAQIATTGPALLEIQVAGASKDTWFVPVNIVRGHLE